MARLMGREPVGKMALAESLKSNLKVALTFFATPVLTQ